MKIKVLKGGPLTTVQDLGRNGYQKYGVLVSGAMDSFSMRLGNILVGNPLGEGVLEMTMLGPTLALPQGLIFALTGADCSATIDGKAVPRFRPIYVKRDCQMRMGFARQGSRGYFAVAGGFDIPLVMGSKSTYLRAKMGGYQGRPLTDGDELTVGRTSEKIVAFRKAMSHNSDSRAFATVSWSAPGGFIFDTATIRVTKGLQYDWFTDESIKTFFSAGYVITMEADRMGYRLKGPALSYKEKKELVSEPVTFGAIQVPADGNPIVLMVDRQTAGGYAKIGQVVCADLPRLAQYKPEMELHFQLVTLAEAEKLYIQQETYLKTLAETINTWLQK